MIDNTVKLCHGALVCEERVELVGDITIGARTLINPNVRIIAEGGPIFIGENNLIEEQTVIINKLPPGGDQNNQKVLVIGDNNVFEVGAYSEALKIGDNNTIECKARLGRDVILMNHCIVGAKCDLNTSEMLVDNTIVYGPNNQRRITSEKPPSHLAQLDFLSKLLPSFHKFKKTNIK